MPALKQFVRMLLLLLFPSNDKSSKSPLLIAISKFTACLLHKISFKSVFWFTVSILLIRRLNSLCEHRQMQIIEGTQSGKYFPSGEPECRAKSANNGHGGGGQCNMSDETPNLTLSPSPDA